MTRRKPCAKMSPMGDTKNRETILRSIMKQNKTVQRTNLKIQKISKIINNQMTPTMK